MGDASSRDQIEQDNLNEGSIDDEYEDESFHHHSIINLLNNVTAHAEESEGRVSLLSDWSESEHHFLNDVELWAPANRQCSKTRSRLMACSRSINIIDFLVSRETGQNPRSSKIIKSSILLSFTLTSSWSAVSRLSMLSNARTLLGRKLYRWEGTTLIFMQNNTIKRSFQSKLRKHELARLIEDARFIAPVTLIDIFECLLRAGMKLDSKDKNENNLLLTLIKHYEPREDIADFLEFTLKRGCYDLTRSGQEAIELLCHTIPVNCITNARLRMIEALFEAGLKLSEKAERFLIASFTGNILKLANESALKILKLLLEHGCQANKGLLSIGWIRYPCDPPPPADGFDWTLKIANCLIENGAQVNPTPNDVSIRCYPIKLLDAALSDPSEPSLFVFLKTCVARGLNVKVIAHKQKNLLMNFCKKYTNKDLPDVIRLLCANGIDVNAVNMYRKNALFYLADNRLANRRTICEAVRSLIELGINVNHTNSNGSNALISFMTCEIPDQCCLYKTLQHLNNSYFWEILHVLLDAGIEVNPVKKFDSSDALFTILLELSNLVFEYPNVCADCLKRDFAHVSRAEAIISVDTVHFEKVFKLIERLIKCGAYIDTRFSSDFANALHFACANFEREQLVSLVRLLCENGVDVNAKTTELYYEEFPDGLDAIGVMQERITHAQDFVDELIEIMKPYGYDCGG